MNITTFAEPDENLFQNTSLNNFNNTSQTSPLKATWTVTSVLSLVTFIFGILSNGILLLLFAKDRTLLTPFNVYLINLLIANLSCVLTQYPFDIVNNLYAFQWYLGERVCTLYLYGSFVLNSAIFNAHQLIAINRVWAVVHPLSYRDYHSTKTALTMCGAMWIYIHLFVAPGWALDALFHRLPVNDHGCALNTEALHSWNLAVQILCFYWPQLLMILALPIIYLGKRMHRRRVHQRFVAPTILVTPVEMADMTLSLRSEAFQRSSRSPKDSRYSCLEPPSTSYLSSSEDEHCSNARRVSVVTCLDADSFSKRSQELDNNLKNPGTDDRSFKLKEETMTTTHAVRRRTHGNALLALLTLTVTVCWTPIDVYYALTLFIPGYDVPVYYQVASVLFSLQTILDPIMFTLALSNLRRSLLALLKQ
ncbi:hypothetical protein BV898_03149 [Hypsibius exemplaris]|uniref:G-protein coupled receptors family 1 profile domain-containing protein n=1 Tax=Hypsibius exemplaris TaxID=2072580 RepID=A0A1W0X6S8_HYPEX|nr:hypothetical protein BV898_03149 [Hypsibius exemplaris]